MVNRLSKIEANKRGKTICELYLSGLSQSETARYLSISTGNVEHFLKKNNIKTRTQIEAQPRGAKHSLWKGDEVSYSGLHYWIQRKLGQPSLCEECGTTTAKRFEWANISGEYKRILDDWVRLCKKCHNLYDNVYKKMWDNRTKNSDKICESCKSIVYAKNLCRKHYAKKNNYWR